MDKDSLESSIITERVHRSYQEDVEQERYPMVAKRMRVHR